MRPRSGIPIDRDGERSDREATTGQAGSPGLVAVPSDTEELDKSSLEDYKSDSDADSDGDKPGRQINTPDESDYKPDVESDESSDKSDEELRYNKLPGEGAGPKKRKADDATVGSCKKSRLG